MKNGIRVLSASVMPTHVRIDKQYRRSCSIFLQITIEAEGRRYSACRAVRLKLRADKRKHA